MSENWVEQLRYEAKKYLDNVIEFEKDLETLRSSAEKLHTNNILKLRSLAEENEAAFSAIASREKELNDFFESSSIKREQLNKEIMDLGDYTYESGKDIRAAKSKITKAIKAKQSEIDVLQSKIKGFAFWKSYNEEKSQIVALRKEISDLQQQYDATNGDYDRKKSEYAQKKQMLKDLDKERDQKYNEPYQLSIKKKPFLHEYLEKINKIFNEMVSAKKNEEYKALSEMAFEKLLKIECYSSADSSNNHSHSNGRRFLTQNYYTLISFLRMIGVLLPSEYKEEFALKNTSIPCVEASNTWADKMALHCPQTLELTDVELFSSAENNASLYSVVLTDENFQRIYEGEKSKVNTDPNFSPSWNYFVEIKMQDGFEFGKVVFNYDTATLLADNIKLGEEIYAPFNGKYFSKEFMKEMVRFVDNLPKNADLPHAIEKYCFEILSVNDKLFECFKNFEKLYRETPEEKLITEQRYFLQKQLEEQRAAIEAQERREHAKRLREEEVAFDRCIKCAKYPGCNAKILNCRSFVPRYR